ncbi:MAG TPA: hypothetical protein VGN57_11530 [Pirellulaceae bacterium]|jgi:hypothetical protein|nr:hypothetical protein [Pirellulaceae bacterium]
MFRRIARSIPRFGLPTLLAAMLLAISVGGAARYGLGPEHGEAAALRALEDESIGYRVRRPSGTAVDSESLSAVAWNPFTRIGNWIAGFTDRIIGIEARFWPSKATRETLFDLPHLQSLSFKPPTDRSPTEGPDAVPTPEEILGRPLPEFPPMVVLAPEPPPVPRGVPLSDEERDRAIAEMKEAWKSPPTFLQANYLCRAESTDFPGTTRLTVSQAPSAWLLRYERVGTKASARTELWTPETSANRVWHEGGWRTYSARRGPNGPGVSPWVGPVWPSDFTAGARSWWLQGEAEELYESVERLEDGTLAFRLKPRELPVFPNRTYKLHEGLFIVDPTDDFAIRRFEMVNEENGTSGTRTSFCYLFEHDRIAGHDVPVRTSSWTDLPAHPIDDSAVIIPAGPRTAVARYAWEFNPVVPASLFEPPTGKGDFFTSTPSTQFHWWYVTGGLALGWIYFAATNGIRRRFLRKKAERRSPPESRNAIAETIGAS